MSLSDVVYRIVDAYDGPGCDGLAVERLRAALAEAWDLGARAADERIAPVIAEDNPYREANANGN